MAGTVTFTYDLGDDGKGLLTGMRVVIVDWTSDASGNATGTSIKLAGMMLKAVTIPGTAGSAPTDNYDIDITDSDTVNVLTACKTGLHDRDTANTEETYLFVVNQDTTPLSMGRGPVVCDALTVAITNAGNAKSGRIKLTYVV
jgi:hypothetical protein